MKRLIPIILILLLLSSCAGKLEPIPKVTSSPIPPMDFSVKEVNEIDIVSRNVLPDYFDASAAQAWDSTGIDESGTFYFGITLRRTDEFKGKEDYVVLSYRADEDKLTYHGSFMDSANEAGNLEKGEQLPKGHTQHIYYEGKMYMGSQNFHDAGKFNTLTTHPENIPLEKMHGAHLFSLDIETGKLEDATSHLENGVLIENEGILQIRLIPNSPILVCMTIPNYKLVFYNLETKEVEKIVETLNWTPGNPQSRELVIINNRIYIYRGVEDNLKERENLYPICYYDMEEDELVDTGVEAFGGFWNGQCTTPDNSKTFVSSCCGELFSIDHETYEIEHLGNLKIEEKKTLINYLYSLCMSPDGRKIFYLPSTYVAEYGLMEYNIESKEIRSLSEMPLAVYTGNGIMDSEYRLYFTKFGNNSLRAGTFKLCVISFDVSY